MSDNLFNKKELCNYLNISRATLDRWRDKGLPFIKIDKTIRFNKDEAMEWVIKNGKK